MYDEPIYGKPVKTPFDQFAAQYNQTNFSSDRPGPVVDARCLPSETTTWLTPPWILKALGEFDLDPCCPEVMPWLTAATMIHQPDDGLAIPWHGRVWLNPPYGRGIERWMQRMAEHGRGTALVFARTDAKWFQNYVFKGASALLFLARRVKFCLPDGSQFGSPAASSVLVAYGRWDADILRRADLQGAYYDNLAG